MYMIKLLDMLSDRQTMHIHHRIDFGIRLFRLADQRDMLNQFLQGSGWIASLTILQIKAIIEQP